MRAIWNYLEQFVASKGHNDSIIINDGCSDREIANLESKLGVLFPEDFKASYKLHNGQDIESVGIIPQGHLLSLYDIYSHWQSWNKLFPRGTDEDVEPDDAVDIEIGIKKRWWHSKWIPIIHDGSSNYLCLDLDPSEGGTYGQIITMERDNSERIILASSFEEWMAIVVNEFKNGSYSFDNAMGVIQQVQN